MVDQLSRIYAMEFIRSLAHTMLGIYLPIYILDTGSTTTELSLFFISVFTFNAISAFLSLSVFRRRMGVGLFVSLIFRGTFYFSLFWAINWHVIAPIFGFGVGLYWSLIDLSLITLPRKEESGLRIGILYMLMQIAGIIGPMIGGFIITDFGYSNLFLIAALILVPTAFLALLVGKLKTDFEIPSARFVKEYYRNSKDNRLLFVFIPIYGLITAQMWVYYPLLLRQWGQTELGMGIIQTIVGILVALTLVGAGKLFDLNRGRYVIISSLLLQMISLLLLGVAWNVEAFTVAGWMVSVASSLMASPFWATIAGTTEKRFYPSLVILVSALLNSGRVVAFVSFSPLLASGNLMVIYFVIAGVALVGLVIALNFSGHFYSARNRRDYE
ncbi:MAG: MFS transporter [Candidatus Hodarchaeota archaeon]